MYKIILNGITNKYEYDELIKVFLKPNQYELVCDSDFVSDEQGKTGAEQDEKEFEMILVFDKNEKNVLLRKIYLSLSKLTGKTPTWGIHTGVRPLKLVGELYKKFGSMEQVTEHLKDFYLFSDEKIALLRDTYAVQQGILGESDVNAVGIYIGIPFCPTRCLYCSFTSNQVGEQLIQAYLDALHIEMEQVGKGMAEKGWIPESIYIGGGTPTTITAEQLDKLLKAVHAHFDCSKLREFTVEAGRPDTITREKLEVIKNNGVKRISINPQSMNDQTLELIGRSHNSDEILNAFDLAREVGISSINADIIAGLPDEDLGDFEKTLDAMIGLSAENITIHTLAVKRASKLIDLDSDFHYKQAQIVNQMLDLSKEKLSEHGYIPYYLYRQKHMAGSLENVGYSRPGFEGIYNIRIMEERQTIIALGAGGITKVYYPDENRLERIPNVSNYEIYVTRLNEMIKRKDDNLFRR
ncbi:coproporphyrinogen dehydrogenase HemZ [Clostridium aminobutyricum]|uniref:Coproporphyrinogen dehydrogenase HemZ n=1 Tax=Clostridium aminobutyricum TaxID=33953 RepID=A0A939D7B8_CLOAM|nr:coproporphyrinogen dehydrogenase HemZ [Clostridium aminobutyricum]MBN7772440.1 coproporphyrinogen dehydrogenase HemZ [Clostridium aminobutyricum]